MRHRALAIIGLVVAPAVLMTLAAIFLRRTRPVEPARRPHRRRIHPVRDTLPLRAADPLPEIEAGGVEEVIREIELALG